MAKTLRTSGNYTVKAGAGSAGSNIITLDAADVKIPGNLVVEGETTYVETTNLKVEDSIIILNKNNSGEVDIDSGIMIERGNNGNNASIYWNEGEDVFKVVTTTSGHEATSITDTALANLRVASPISDDDAATRKYVNDQVVAASGMTSFTIAGDSGSPQTINDANTVTLAGGNNINTVTSATDTLTINLTNNLIDIHSITNSSTNANLTISTNGTGSILINDVLSFNANRSGEPGANSVTKLFAMIPGSGGTGLFFNNTSVSSGAMDELISKKKATALAIALG